MVGILVGQVADRLQVGALKGLMGAEMHQMIEALDRLALLVGESKLAQMVEGSALLVVAMIALQVRCFPRSLIALQVGANWHCS